MEPVALIVTALVAGATAGLSGTAAKAVADAYETLKALVVGCFRRAGVPEDDGHEVVAHASESVTQRAALEGQLTAVEIDEPTLQAARELLDLLQQADLRKFHVEVHGSTGVQVGDENEQTINIHPR